MLMDHSQCVYRSEAWVKRIYNIRFLLHYGREPKTKMPPRSVMCLWRYADLLAKAKMLERNALNQNDALNQKCGEPAKVMTIFINLDKINFSWLFFEIFDNVS